jgi:hypothetical protein
MQVYAKQNLCSPSFSRKAPSARGLKLLEGVENQNFYQYRVWNGSKTTANSGGKLG